MAKTLYLLVGPKGSGKTHIGTLINQHTDIKFLRVETIWLTIQPGEDGWKKVEDAIDAEFAVRDKLMVESLGAGDGFKRYYASLKSKYSIKMIRVHADLETCLKRVQTRDSAGHIPVSDEKVMEFNEIAASVAYEWDAEIENTIPAADEQILKVILSI